jgi:hypothetical protein
MELILGLPPMSQYDAAATPLYAAFESRGVTTPYVRRDPRVSLDETNADSAWGAASSMEMDFSEPDRAPEGPLNEILWRSIRGPTAAAPPPVRAAFVRDVPDADRGQGNEPSDPAAGRR